MFFGKTEFFVIAPHLMHILFWIEERGEETNGLDDPIGDPRII